MKKQQPKRFNLNQKLVFGTLVGIAVSLLIFVIVFTVLYEKQLYVEHQNTVKHINTLIHTSLKEKMLNNSKSKLNRIMRNLTKMDTNLLSVAILSNQGVVSFSSQLKNIGTKTNDNFADIPYLYKIISKPNKVDILRNISPIKFEKACTRCHEISPKHTTRGYIAIDYDVSNVRVKVFKSLLLLMGSGALIVLINIIGGLWFIRHFILKPINQISLASNAFSTGKLDTRITLNSNDELSDLATSFNFMAENLDKKIQQLKTSKLFLQNLIDTFPDAICVIDKDFEIILSNQTYKDKHKITQSNKKCYQMHFQKDAPCVPTLVTCPAFEILQNHKGIKTIQKHKDKKGNTYYVEVSAMPMYIEKNGVQETLIIESIRDFNTEITHSHESRLEEFGMLSCGVAHEILNPLSSVSFALSACMNLCRDEKMNSDHLLSNLKIIESEIQVCIKVTDRLLKLGAAPSEKFEIVFVKNAVLDTLELLQWEAEKGNIKITHHYENEDELIILGADSDLRIVTLNLVHNAFHAMPNGGEIAVNIKVVGEFIEITFSDNGIGINPKDMQRIFYPFYTQRADASKGLGLGLAICQNIIKKYNGILTADSTLKKGTVFTIRLPRNRG